MGSKTECGRCGGNRTRWQVLAADTGKGRKVVFECGNEATAKTVAKRYRGSTVREKPKDEKVARRGTNTAAKR